MADRYQDRRFPAGNFDHGGDQRGAGQDDSDPLAELARLIGQTDPFGNVARTPPRGAPRERYQPQHEPPPPAEEEPPAPSGPPPWMRRANARAVQREVEREIPSEPEYPASEHPVHRYAQPVAPDEQYVEEEPVYEEAERQADPSRYDEALYDQLDAGVQDYPREPAYPNDPYAYQDGYEDEKIGRRAAGRRGRLFTVAAVLALAVVGTGAAFAYRTYFNAAHSTEPPIIKADNSPTKIVPAPGDSIAKSPDRMPSGDGTEKIVSREETPIDINRSGAPRVVFPPLNQNANPPAAPSVSTSTMPSVDTASGAVPTNGILPSGEPHKIKTFAVRGDQPDGAASPVAVSPTASPKSAASSKPAAPATRAVAPAPANAPLSLAPDASTPPAPAAEARTRVATTTPNAAPAPATASGGYLVQVSSQRSESDAQASFKTLQTKFPSVLGSQTPLIKRADLGDKGIYYRAMVGPFGTPEEAAQFCGSLKSAGGQCVVQRN